MSVTKVCWYKGCQSVQYAGSSTGETFFQFPRDSVRYKQWVKNSQCEDLDVKMIKYLCSKHFDPHKYISTNPRRKLLLANAIPYEYESEDDEPDQEPEMQEIQDVVVSTQFEEETDDTELMEEIQKIVETTKYVTSNQIAESSVVDEYQIEDRGYKNENIVLHNVKKRKLPTAGSTIAEPTFTKKSLPAINDDNKKDCMTVRIQPSGSISEIPERNIEINEDELIANSSITTFIFGGKEYVQMPKSVYIEEKSDLLKNLLYYKNIIDNIKKQIANIET